MVTPAIVSKTNSSKFNVSVAGQFGRGSWKSNRSSQ